ncbi:hypothetical protein Gasu2_30370 [Galdieria sulphuraria]|nr:hypothetical protein Gasu2_30370 [Galdieria sulphuraria]
MSEEAFVSCLPLLFRLNDVPETAVLSQLPLCSVSEHSHSNCNLFEDKSQDGNEFNLEPMIWIARNALIVMTSSSRSILLFVEI